MKEKEYLWLFDTKLNLVDCNEAVLHLKKMTRAQLIGCKVTIFLANANPTRELNQFKQLLKDGKSFSTTTTIKSSKQGTIQLVSNVSRMGNGFAMIGKEIVEVSPLKEYLPDYRLNMDLIAQKSPDIFMLIDLNGKILYINRAVKGYTVEQVIGTSSHDYLSTEEINIMKNSFNKVLRTKQPDRYEISSTFFNDETLYFDSSVAPVIKDGKIEAFAVTTRNKTAIKELMQEAEIGKNKYLELLLHTGAIGFIQDKKLRYTHIFNPNPAFEAKDVIGKTDEELLLDKDNAAILKQIKSTVLKTGIPVRKDVETIIDGSSFFYDLMISPIFNSKGEITGIKGISYDITKHKKAILHIKKQTVFFEKIANGLPSIVSIFCYAKNRYIFLNTAINTILGYSKTEFSEKRNYFAKHVQSIPIPFSTEKLIAVHGNLAYFIHTDDINTLMLTFDKIFKSKENEIYEVEYRARHKKGHWVWINHRIIPFSRTKKGTIVRILDISTDISNRKNAELEGKKAIMEGQEKERQRIAADLHDAINPLLSTTKLTLESLRRKLKQAKEGEKKILDNAVDLLNKSMNEVRGIVINLSPPVLKDFGLSFALSELCEEISGTDGILVVFDTHGLQERFNKKIEINLFRIAQELLHNVIKHANASTVDLQLIQHFNSIILMVNDNGIGIKRTHNNKITEGFGFKNIKNRIAAFEGKMEVDSTKGKGTIITIELPI